MRKQTKRLSDRKQRHHWRLTVRSICFHNARMKHIRAGRWSGHHIRRAKSKVGEERVNTNRNANSDFMSDSPLDSMSRF